MKKLLILCCLPLLCLACSEDESVTAIPSLSNTPTVWGAGIHPVETIKEVVYARGLSHESTNSAEATSIPLQLDVYRPIIENGNHPAFVFIHGGGFIGGSKEQKQIVDMAQFFASRGWVFIAINYRLRDDRGTLPQEWLQYASFFLTETDAAQFLAIYPAQRDAMAALRWVITQAETYHINTDHITVGGGSAGAITALTVGISEPGDFKDELSLAEDPTLATTHPDETFKVRSIVDLWGSKAALDAREIIYGPNRFDAGDPPLLVVHGTEDPTVPFTHAEDLKTVYENLQLPLSYYPLPGYGHSAWSATIDGKRLNEVIFDFITNQQELIVE